MARNAHTTKRPAPAGYTAVTQPFAAQLYAQGVQITLCGSKVRPFHVFGGWHLGWSIGSQPELDQPTFAERCAEYCSYLAYELGPSLVYYVATSDLPKKGV